MSLLTGEALDRYNDLLREYRDSNSIDLQNGKCACVKCQKLFRSFDYLKMHFNRVHAQDLISLEQQAKNDSVYRPNKPDWDRQKQNVYFEESDDDEESALKRALDRARLEDDTQ